MLFGDCTHDRICVSIYLYLNKIEVKCIGRSNLGKTRNKMNVELLLLFIGRLDRTKTLASYICQNIMFQI